MMKKFAIAGVVALASMGCSQAPTANQNAAPANSNAMVVQKPSDSLVVPSHREAAPSAPVAPGADTAAPSAGGKTKWTQSGTPIDTAKFDADIAAAEKNLKAKPADEGLKKALAAAYVARGTALTEARQYASALGDYRRALKNEPGNADAKRWMEEIIMIYDSLNKDYPKEGEEPPPLPFKG